MTRLCAPLAAAMLLTPPPLHVAQNAPPAIDIAALVQLASGWVVRFETSLSGVLFHERYRQSFGGVGVTTTRLPFEANIVLITPPGADRFIVYRDIYRASGQDLTDHTNRLQLLLEANTASSVSQAERLTNASARLNLGPVARNINTPTMAFEYLKPAHLARLRVRPAGREVIDGRELIVIEFQEIGSPTLVRGDYDVDAPAWGRYWIDPASGAVPRAAIELNASPYRGRLDVKLALHEELKIWVPTEMTELWTAARQRVNGLATYDRFERLAVTTEEIIK